MRPFNTLASQQWHGYCTRGRCCQMRIEHESESPIDFRYLDACSRLKLTSVSPHDGPRGRLRALDRQSHALRVSRDPREGRSDQSRDTLRVLDWLGGGGLVAPDAVHR